MGPGRHRSPKVPEAARRPVTPPPAPRRTNATPAATKDPASGPTMYAHQAVSTPRMRAGASERAGFMEAPLTGAPMRPARRCPGPRSRGRPSR